MASLTSVDASPDAPASSRRRVPPVPATPGFAEAVGPPSTVTESADASGAPPAAGLSPSMSAAFLMSVAQDVRRDPTLASPRLVELLSLVLPRNVSPDDVQRRMGSSHKRSCVPRPHMPPQMQLFPRIPSS